MILGGLIDICQTFVWVCMDLHLYLSPQAL